MDRSRFYCNWLQQDDLNLFRLYSSVAEKYIKSIGVLHEDYDNAYLEDYKFREDKSLMRLLKSMKTAVVKDIDAITFSGDVPGLEIAKRKLFVRDFYPRLFDEVLLRDEWRILIGNPGVSKSMFQW